jgi:predicted TIM-barrel fold metal-dependent hydrolase
MKTTRRQFLCRSAGVLTTGVVAHTLAGRTARAAADKEPSLPIVDTHEHLWDLSRANPAWMKPDNPLYRSYLTKDYEEATRGLNVVKSVYMEVAMAPADQLAEAEYVIDICRRAQTPMCAAVIGGQPAADDFRQYLLRFKDSPYVKGVRHFPATKSAGKELALPDTYAAGIRLLGELGMCFDLCVPATALADGASLVDQCPGTRFVLDHCGNADAAAFSSHPWRTPSHQADQWRRGLAAVASRKNVVCKISGIVSRVNRDHWGPEDLAPIVNHCLDAFGPDRVVFAGDWPVCTKGAPLREWVKALKEIVRNRPEAEQRKLFHDNAVKFYGLS